MQFVELKIPCDLQLLDQVIIKNPWMMQEQPFSFNQLTSKP